MFCQENVNDFLFESRFSKRQAILSKICAFHRPAELAIKLFYRLAGLTGEPTDELPYPVEHLRWGLEQLAGLQVDTTLLFRAKGYVGLTDALVRGTLLQSQWANCDLIEQCSHAYNELLASLPLIETF